MEFKTLAELVQYVDKAFASKFYSGASVVRKGSLKIIASVVGGALYMLMLLAKRIWKNRFVSTCGPEALDGFGVEYGIPHKAPLHAMGMVKVTLKIGYSTVTIPAETYFVDPVTNREYKTVSSTTVNSTNSSCKVISVGVGAEYNAESSTDLKFRDSTPEGVEEIVYVVSSAGLIRGYAVDVVIDGETQQWGETVEEYRARILERIQNPAHGGSVSDYKQWATRFDYVTNAYVKAGDPKANTVCVAVADYNNSTMKLESSQLTEVSNYIKDDVRRPITADVKVFNVTPVEVSFVASVVPYNAEVVESVKNSLYRICKNIGPGESKTVEEIKAYILSNSLAKKVKSLSVAKSGVSVNTLSMEFNGFTEKAEVINAKPNILNGEA